jgi:hypothetical protein
MPKRRFPPPWTVENDRACFMVKAQSGQVLAYVYYEEEPGRRSAANLLTPDASPRTSRENCPSSCAGRACNLNLGSR